LHFCSKPPHAALASCTTANSVQTLLVCSGCAQCTLIFPLLPIITAIASVYDWATHGDLQIKSNQFIYQPTQVQKSNTKRLKNKNILAKMAYTGF